VLPTMSAIFLCPVCMYIQYACLPNDIEFFCSHRHSSSHLCHPPASQAEPKNATARQLLMKHFPPSKPRTQATSTKKVPTNAKKLAQYRNVELMKMRHRAMPGNPQDRASSLPIEQRLHVNVRLDGDDAERSFWFCKVRPYSLPI